MSLSGAAAEFIEREFGGAYEEETGLVAISNNPTKILGSDPDRVALTFINDQTATIYITPDNGPSGNRGIQLDANGGSVSMNVRDDLTLPAREWWGYTGTPTQNIFFIAVRRFAQSASKPASK
jgi:hypothetical protein